MYFWFEDEKRNKVNCTCKVEDLHMEFGESEIETITRCYDIPKGIIIMLEDGRHQIPITFSYE